MKVTYNIKSGGENKITYNIKSGRAHENYIHYYI